MEKSAQYNMTIIFYGKIHIFILNLNFHNLMKLSAVFLYWIGLFWVAHSALSIPVADLRIAMNSKIGDIDTTGPLDNQLLDGYRGIWFELGQKYEYGDK